VLQYLALLNYAANVTNEEQGQTLILI